MDNNLSFPKDGTIELATEKLVDGIINDKFNEKEIDFLSKEFRYCEPLNKYDKKYGYGAPRYGAPVKLSISAFTREELEQGIKTGLEKDKDLLLDMKYSGQLVPVPQTYFTNDIDTDEYAENSFKDIIEGYSPSELGITRLITDESTQIFFHKLLGDNLYNSDKAEAIHRAGDDFDLATTEFLKFTNNEIPEVKEQLLADFKEIITEYISEDSFIYQKLLDDNYENAIELLKDDGYLKENGAYLFISKTTGQVDLKNIEKFDDITEQMTEHLNNYSVSITHKKDTPYFEGKVSDHDGISSYYILPESQWDKVEAYSFLQESIKNTFLVKDIFHSRKMERKMEKESKNNPIVKKMLEVYGKEIYNVSFGDTAEVHNSGYIKEDAWFNVSKYLASKIVQGTSISNKDFKTCEELLVKFNPTLIPAEEISKFFKNACQEQLKYNEKIVNKQNSVQR